MHVLLHGLILFVTFRCQYSQRVQKNEIFVDLLERLTVLVASNGNILRSHLDGSLIMRSFLGGHAGMYMYVPIIAC